jgi:uncharacterized phiE125 gp8 family phage protein
MSLQITTQPVAEPVTLDEVKARLRLTSTDDDSTISSLITVAREYAESVTGWSLAGKAYIDTRDRFPYHPNEPIQLYRPPLLVVVGVQYLDDTYTWQPWDPSEYYVAAANVPAVILPKVNLTYPVPVRAPGCVQISYTVGQSAYTPHLEAIRALAVHLYSHPELITSDGLKEVPFAITTMLNVKKIHYF